MNELKPCPFCGGEAKLFPYKIAVQKDDGVSEPRTAWFVACANRCGHAWDTIFYKREDDAIDEWNRRINDHE